jgi:hypothetical protein
MAKKRADTVPLVLGQSLKLKLDDSDWKTLESAYGQSLSREQRERIFDATQTYIDFRTREISSQPLRDSVRRVERLRRSAESFHKTLVEGDESSTAKVFARHEIKLQFSDDYLVAPDSIAGLTHVVGSFVSACETVLENHLNKKKQLRDIKANGVPSADGTAWRTWIVELTSVTEEFGIPSGARTDTDKNKRDEQSPFVRLVKELDAQLPKKVQQHARQSYDTLARAINRARESYRRDKSSATSNAKKSRKE